MHYITSWQEKDIARLSSRAKKRYKKRKSAIQAYFTTDASIDDITLRYQLSSEILLQLAEKCLMLHEDGTPWGFRALFPGVTVIDHTPQPVSSEETATSKADEYVLSLAENDIASGLPVGPQVEEDVETPAVILSATKDLKEE